MNTGEYLEKIEKVIAQGPYQADWESLCEHPVPNWYQKGKFGIFIHWGVYSVPAFGNEWYARNVYKKDSPEYQYHVRKYGTLDKFGYKDLIPMFKAENFSADEWMELFEKAGARFVMPVAEHHDGFQMYASDLCRWNAAQMGPCRDVLGELKTAADEKGIRFCASSHRAEHWWFYDKGREIPEADVNDPDFSDLYGPAEGPMRDWESLYDNPPSEEFLEDWLVRTCELIDKYRPGILFFDWWIQNYAFKPYLKKLAAYYYNRAAEWGVEVAINAKYDAFVHGSAVCDIERGQMANISHFFWQTDTSVAKNSWGYTVGNDYKKSNEIVCDLVDVVSKNGALLLNVGPMSDGRIPEEDKQILLDVGAWLKVNGEAIYDTKCWKVSGEGPTEVPDGAFSDTERDSYTSEDIRFTCKGSAIYAAVLKWPEDGKVKIRSIGKYYKTIKTTVKSVEVLGYDTRPEYGFGEALSITADFVEKTDMPVVLKITVE